MKQALIISIFKFLFYIGVQLIRGFPGGSVVKNLPANTGDARDASSILGLGRSSGVGNENPLQYSCLENSIDKGNWQAAVHEVTKSWTLLSTPACMHDSGLTMLCQFQVYNKVIQLYISMYLVFKFFPHLGYYRILSRVPYALQQAFIGYLF